MKDERLYAQFTLDFPDHPKILCLSVDAKWALVEMTIYSRRHLTDGWLNKRVALAKWGASVCLELASNDVENPSLIESDEGFQIHDFAAHQRTKLEINELREKRRAAGQKGGKARAKQVSKQNGGKIKPETETETNKEKGASDGFDAFWNAYPRKVGRKVAEKAYAKAVADVAPASLVSAARAYAAAVKDSDQKFIAHPTTWLNQGRWDEFDASSRQTPEEFLNDCWEQATLAPIEEITGQKPDCIRWPDPEPPDFDRQAFLTDFRRRWIKENRDSLVEALRGRL